MTQEKLLTTGSAPQMPEDPFGQIDFRTEMYGNRYPVYSGNRDAALQELLGTDYEYAHRSGLINDFYYNPDNGKDGLMHVLGGEYFVMDDGTRIPGGFHHEPSAQVAWVLDAQGNKLEQSTTYVDRTHLEDRDSRTRRRPEFRELPYEPYQARVVVDGLKKKTFAKDPQTGETRLYETNNGMFPKQYDALAVMQAVKIARDTRDKKNDKVDEKNRVIITNGHSPMLDGESYMNIALVLDAASDKILSAYPVVRKQNPMKLSRQDIKQHLGVEA